MQILIAIALVSAVCAYATSLLCRLAIRRKKNIGWENAAFGTVLGGILVVLFFYQGDAVNPDSWDSAKVHLVPLMGLMFFLSCGFGFLPSLFAVAYHRKRIIESANQSRQPTPGERLGSNSHPQARRGCARRSRKKMDTAYEHLRVVFAALTRVDDAFQAARKQISKLPETKATYSFAHFGDYNIHGTDDTGTAWEIEIAAMRDGTEARWHLEIELTHSSMSCELSADAGFQGKYGPMELREIEPIAITDLDALSSHVDHVLEQLFSNLEGDCQAAIKADREEMEAFQRARSKTDSESGRR